MCKIYCAAHTLPTNNLNEEKSNKYLDCWNLVLCSQQACATYQILHSPQIFGKMKLASTRLPGLNHKTTLVVAMECFRTSMQEKVSPSILQ
jgi:hypothetical protein